MAVKKYVLTGNDRMRLYVALVPCLMCGAKRGEMCFVRPGKPMRSGYHYTRGASVQRGRADKSLTKQYNRLLEQIVGQGPIPDHE